MSTESDPKSASNEEDAEPVHQGNDELKENKRVTKECKVYYSFKDLLLKPKLLNALVDLGMEHPSEGK